MLFDTFSKKILHLDPGRPGYILIFYEMRVKDFDLFSAQYGRMVFVEIENVSTRLVNMVFQRYWDNTSNG
jgi:hypothetical protein